MDQANELQERIAGMKKKKKMPTPGENYEQTANPRVQEMEAKSSKISASKASKSASSRSASSGNTRSYTVKKGDTLWSVAKRAGMSADALRKLNQLDSNEPLKLGQTIALSGSSTSSTKTSTANTKTTSRVSETFTPSTKNSANSTTSSSKKGQTTYKVKSGDTLSAISRKYNLNVNDIARWNGLNKNNSALKPGQSLTLHLDAGKH